MKEIAILTKGSVLSHYIFTSLTPFRLLTRSERSQVAWLIGKHHNLQWEDRNIPYYRAKRLIIDAVTLKDASSRVYVKGHETREWLTNLLEDDARIGLIIETLDNDYDDVPALDKLDATLRYDRHVRNCALQNVFKIFNWWSNHHHEGSINPYLH